MKRMPFERPTEHYDDKISPIDEQICALLKKRKEVSNMNPGFPPPEYISNWAEKFGLYEDVLNSIFGTLLIEDEYKPRVEPKNFIKHVPILKSVEKGDRIYTVTFIRQFENASVVQLNVDWHESYDDHDDESHLRRIRQLHHHHFELSLGEDYDCRSSNGGGSKGNYRYNFIVSPPIPEDYSGLELVFKEYEYGQLLNKNLTGLEIAFSLD